MSTLKEQIMARMSVIAEEAKSALGNPVTDKDRALAAKWRATAEMSASEYAKTVRGAPSDVLAMQSADTPENQASKARFKDYLNKNF